MSKDLTATYSRYWDLTDQQRSSLSDDEFDRLLAVELMEKGATKPAAPNLVPEPVASPLPTTTWYSVGPVVFQTMQDAEAFLDLEPFVTNYDYRVGYDDKYAEEVKKTVSTIELCDQAELKASGSSRKATKEAKEQNKEELERYRKELDAFDSVTADMRNDRHRQVSEAGRLGQVILTYEQYVATANGDHAVASKFIVKAYPTCDVRKAFEWAGETWANDPDLPKVYSEVSA